MRGHLLDGAGHVGQIVGAVGAQGADVLGGANRMMDHRPLAGLELEGQAHGLKRQQQIGKDDGRVHAQLFGGGDGDLGGDLGLLADLHQRVVLAHVAVFLHVAACLAQKPDRGAVDGSAQAGANKAAAVQNGVGSGLGEDFCGGLGDDRIHTR